MFFDDDDVEMPNDFFESPTAAMSSELPLLLFSTRNLSVRAGVVGAEDEFVVEVGPPDPNDNEAIVMVLGGSTVRRC